MLQQMLLDDKCDQVRCACSKSLAMVINEIDDESRLSQVGSRLCLLISRGRSDLLFSSVLSYWTAVYRIQRTWSCRQNDTCYLRLRSGVWNWINSILSWSNTIWHGSNRPFKCVPRIRMGSRQKFFFRRLRRLPRSTINVSFKRSLSSPIWSFSSLPSRWKAWPSKRIFLPVCLPFVHYPTTPRRSSIDCKQFCRLKANTYFITTINVQWMVNFPFPSRFKTISMICK